MKETRIVVNIRDQNELYNSYNDSILNSELSNYLFNQLRGKSLKAPVIICINTKKPISQESQEKICHIINNNFFHINLEDDIQTKAHKIRSIILLIIGLVLIWLFYFLDINKIYIFEEVILILGWVAIWEVADYLMFEDTQNKIKSKRIDQLTKAKIIFESSDENI